MNLRLLSKSIFVFTILLVLPIIFNGCCDEKYRIVRPGIIAANLEYYDGTSLEEITGPFVISAFYETEFISSLKKRPGLISNAFALSCDQTIVNKLNQSSIKISCDKSFTIGNILVEPNTNFILSNGIDMEFIEHIRIKMSQDFFDEASFTNEVYTFHVSVETSDELVLTYEIELYMNL